MEGKEVVKRPNLDIAEPTEPPRRLSREDKLYATYAAVRNAHDLVYVEEMDSLYKREGVIYQPQSQRQLDDLITRASGDFGFRLLRKDYNEVIELAKIHCEAIERPSMGCIKISEGLFWDRERGEISRGPTQNTFFGLFNTRNETKHVVRIPPFTEQQEELFMSRYEQVKAELQRGEEVERYEFLKTSSL